MQSGASSANFTSLLRGIEDDQTGDDKTMVLAANKDVPASVAVARQLESQLRAVGIDVQPALVSRESLLRDYLGPRAFHVALVKMSR